MPKLIALHGPAGSGKSYCADIFQSAHGYMRVKFADPLKNMVKALLYSQGVPECAVDRYIEGDLKELPTHYFSGSSPRQVMQGLGEWGRAIDEDFWASKAMVRTRGFIRSGYHVIVDDCRHVNEAKMIEDIGGVVIEVVGRVPTVAAPKHISEERLPEHLISDFLENGTSQLHTHREVQRLNLSNQGYIK